MNEICNWWFSKIPRVHRVADTFRDKIYYWFIHPIKRRIAKYYLFLLRRFFGLKVIGITGSTGKTTTKEMLASVLRLDGKTVWTRANIDPIYNIPTTILRCCLRTRYLILEMGVEYPGELDFYLWLAKPDIGVITNISITHTLFFGNIEGVFKEKSKLVKNLSKDNWAVLNIEDERLRKLKGKISSKIMWYGESGFVKADDIKFSNNKDTVFNLHIGKISYKAVVPVYGKHFVTNALAASSSAFILGVGAEKIIKGLKDTHIEEHRMNIFAHKSQALIVDDSYNNNPFAANETLIAFKEIAGERKKLVVMGEMLELGSLEKEEHIKLGKRIAEIGIDFTIGVGNASKYMIGESQKSIGKKNVLWLASKNEVNKHLKPFLNKDWAILIKGSRSVGLEKVVDSL